MTTTPEYDDMVERLRAEKLKGGIANGYEGTFTVTVPSIGEKFKPTKMTEVECNSEVEKVLDGAKSSFEEVQEIVSAAIPVISESVAILESRPKKRRGRPKGSKNRPKTHAKT